MLFSDDLFVFITIHERCVAHRMVQKIFADAFGIHFIDLFGNGKILGYSDYREERKKDKSLENDSRMMAVCFRHVFFF